LETSENGMLPMPKVLNFEDVLVSDKEVPDAFAVFF
jgi:hypothetical protein